MHTKKIFDNGAVCDQNSRTNVFKRFLFPVTRI